jgi:uncharacterized C2H2 Zn-finger protein
MITFYRKIKNSWQFDGYECPECGRKFSTHHRLSNHPNVCSRINTLKKQKEEAKMPVQRITKNGEVYYRWGQEGKLYKNREDAAKQGQAAHLSGYRKKD